MSILSGAGLEDLGNIGGCKPDTHAPLRCFGEPRLDVRPEPRKVSSALLVDGNPVATCFATHVLR